LAGAWEFIPAGDDLPLCPLLTQSGHLRSRLDLDQRHYAVFTEVEDRGSVVAPSILCLWSSYVPNSSNSRMTLGRFDILADADLHIALFKLRSNARLRASFSSAEVAMITTVASELGRNILKYGGARGYLLVSWIEDRVCGKGAVEIKAVDYGPGFIDVAAALKDHYSTGGTLGLGLPGSARIMDSLEIESQPGRGATVTAKKWARPHARPNRRR
jgi:serine/threonine-protein kinase RsbT